MSEPRFLPCPECDWDAIECEGIDAQGHPYWTEAQDGTCPHCGAKLTVSVDTDWDDNWIAECRVVGDDDE